MAQDLASYPRVGVWRLVRPLGRGGAAQVWEGRHPGGATAAVKLVVGAPDAGSRRAFAAEVRAVATMDHPHVVRVYDQGEVSAAEATEARGVIVAGQPYLVMELATGGAAADRREPMRWRELRGVALAVLDALSHAHGHGVLHRDLKPANVLFGGERPGPRLADFGLAWALAGGDPNARKVAGTPSFMAPEQVAGAWRDFGPWTDLYAFGVTLWKLATGRVPFRGAASERLQAHVSARLPPFQPAHAMPDGLDALVRRLLEKSPRERPGTAAEAREAFAALPEEVFDPSGPSETPPEPDEPTSIRPLPPIPATYVRWPGPSPLRVPDAPPLRASERALLSGLGLFGVRPLPIVGREDVEERLWAHLREVDRTGSPRAVLLAGETGQGKRALAAALARRAHEAAGLASIRVRHGPIPAPSDGIAPALRRALGADGLSDPELADRIDGLVAGGPFEGHAAPIARALGSEEIDPIERHDGWALAARVVGGGRPVVVVVDDAAYGPLSLAWLQWLLEMSLDGGGPPILAVASVDLDALDPDSAVPYLLERVTEVEGAERIAVPALDAGSTKRLVDAVVSLSPGLARVIARESKGLPASVAQIVADLVEGDALQAATQGYRLRPSVEVALEPDPSARRRVARAAGGRPDDATAVALGALLGPRVDAGEWSAACGHAGVSPGEDLVERLLGRGLATAGPDGSWAFVDRRVAQAVADGAGGERPALHLACARALRDRGAEPVRVGRHLLAAGEGDAALGVLLGVVRERLERSEMGRAQSLLRHLGPLCENLPDTDPRWAEAVVLRALLDKPGVPLADAAAGVARVTEVARARGWPRAEVRAWQALTYLRLRLEAPERALAASRASTEVPGADSKTVLRALVRHAECLTMLGRSDAAAGYLDRARLAAEVLRDPLSVALLGVAEAERAVLAGAPDAADRAREAVARAGRAGLTVAVAEATGALGALALRAGSHGSAERLLRAARYHAQLGSAQFMIVEADLAEILVRQGRPREALHLVSHVEATLRSRMWPQAWARVRLIRWSAADEAHWDALADEAESFATLPTLDREAARRVATFAAERREAAGDPVRARRARMFAARLTSKAPETVGGVT